MRVYKNIMHMMYLLLTNIAMENGPFEIFTDVFPLKTSISKGFSIAMSNNQIVIYLHHTYVNIQS